MAAKVEYQIVHEYHPGAIGRIAELHGTYYHQHWGFGLFFEAKVATEISDFFKRFIPHRDGLWLVVVEDQVEGSLVIDGIDGNTRGAHLRWFILSDVLRGQGVGRELLRNAVDFIQSRNYRKTYLWTFQGLDPARHLYEAFGFVLRKEQTGTQWGCKVTEQYFELNVADIK